MQVKRDRPGGGRRAGQEKITENKTWARKGSRDSIKALLEGSLNTCHPSRCLTCVRTMFLPYMSADIVRWIHAKPDATKRGRPNTEKQRSLRAAWQSETDSTYPKGTFEELLVIAVNWCKYLQELQDALLIIKVGYLLKCLLNQFSKRFSLHKKWKKYTQLNSKQSAHSSTVYIVQIYRVDFAEGRVGLLALQSQPHMWIFWSLMSPTQSRQMVERNTSRRIILLFNPLFFDTLGTKMDNILSCAHTLNA